MDIGNQEHKNSQIYVLASAIGHILTTEGLAQSDQELGRNLVIQDGILWAIYSNQMSIKTLKKIEDVVYMCGVFKPIEFAASLVPKSRKETI